MKTGFPSLRIYQFSIGPQQRVELLSLSLSMLECLLAWSCTDLIQILCRHCSCSGSWGQDIMSRRWWKTNATCFHPCMDPSIDFHHFNIVYGMKMCLSTWCCMNPEWMINAVSHSMPTNIKPQWLMFMLCKAAPPPCLVSFLGCVIYECFLTLWKHLRILFQLPPDFQCCSHDFCDCFFSKCL